MRRRGNPQGRGGGRGAGQPANRGGGRSGGRGGGRTTDHSGDGGRGGADGGGGVGSSQYQGQRFGPGGDNQSQDRGRGGQRQDRGYGGGQSPDQRSNPGGRGQSQDRGRGSRYQDRGHGSSAGGQSQDTKFNPGGGGPRGDRGYARGGGGGQYQDPRSNTGSGSQAQYPSGGGQRQGGGGSGGSRGESQLKIFSGPGEINDDVTKAEDESVEEAKDAKDLSMSSLKVSDGPQPPHRPKYGTFGKKIKLRANYFEMTTDPGLQLFRYNVTIEPNPSAFPRRKIRRLFQLLLEEAPYLRGLCPKIATDHRAILISARKLDLARANQDCESITYHDDGQTPAQHATIFTFTITFDKMLSIQDQVNYLNARHRPVNRDTEEHLQALNLAVQRQPSSNPQIVTLTGGKKFFSKTQNEQQGLDGGLVALRGYFASVRASKFRLLVNVNVLTSVFYQAGNMRSLMEDYRKSLPKEATSDYCLQALSRFIKGLRIETTHSTKRQGRTVFGLARKPLLGANAMQASFMWKKPDDTTTQVTVQRYFREYHNKTLSSPDYHVIDVGNKDHPNYVPVEYCNVIPGQPANKKLSGVQTTKMLSIACKTPPENAHLIKPGGVRILGLTSDVPHNFGLEIIPDFITVPGRILNAPRVLYFDGACHTDKGGWSMKDKTFCESKSIEKLGFIVFDWQDISLADRKNREFFNEMGNYLRTEMRNCGMEVTFLRPDSGRMGVLSRANFDDKVEDFLLSMKTQGVKFLWVVLPDTNVKLYSSIKYYGDCKYGIHTVCSVKSKVVKLRQDLEDAILEENYGRRRGALSTIAQYFANHALKFNLKAGGTNQELNREDLGIVGEGKTMLVGIDVTHPSPGSQENAPSIAGVVASTNKTCGQWLGSLSRQGSREEMVSKLTPMIVDRLKAWKKHNKDKLPENILVYRDGVSEGQYKTVLREESPCFDKAIKTIYLEKEWSKRYPKVSIIIVGKRHHTRFYPTALDEAELSKGNNPRNGTIVDRGVTSPSHWDFFLQAHTAVQGSARPAHYVVIQNKMDLTVNELESLTHNLSYTFGRATRAVSICPPAYYADLLCERARCYLHDTFNADSISGVGARDRAREEWSGRIHPELQDSMFYI